MPLQDVLPPWRISGWTVPHLIRHAGHDLREDTVKINAEPLPKLAKKHQRFERKQKGATFGIPLISCYLKKTWKKHQHMLAKLEHHTHTHTAHTKRRIKAATTAAASLVKPSAGLTATVKQIANTNSEALPPPQCKLTPPQPTDIFQSGGIISQVVTRGLNPEALRDCSP